MKRISISLSAAFCLSLINSISVSGQSIPVPTPMLRVVTGRTHLGEDGKFPIIDGKLNDFCWKKASRISGFNTLDGTRDIKEQTKVYLLYEVI